MKKQELLNSKTVLQYLILINEKSYVQIGRQLNITPQQFSDWIKKRRPIPKHRLQDLSDYFGVDEDYLVNDKRFAKDISNLDKINIQKIFINRKIENGDEEVEYLKEKLKELEQEKERLIRITRLTAILNKEDEGINKIIDKVMELIESNNIEELERLLN